MNDQRLERLLFALDAAVERLGDAQASQLHGDIEHAMLRVEALRTRLGQRAEASAYLRFIDRLGRARAAEAMAESA